MGFLKILSGKGPEEHEKKGDSLLEAGAYGDAKLEYEAGLHKLEKRDPNNTELKKRLQEKILKSRESLALYHKQRGEEMLDSQYYEGAEDVFHLALELTENPELEKELKGLLQEINDHIVREEALESREIHPETRDGLEQDITVPVDETFAALCGSFSDKERERSYYGYGDAFREGYLALNQGDFSRAALKLSQAMEENPYEKTYIPLELGAAYLNLGKTEEAKGLLKTFLKDYPDSLQGYHLLCEAHWELKEFDDALSLLEDYQGELDESPQLWLLKGETLFHAERFQEAKGLFQNYLDASDWDENITLSLARTHEALGEKEEARHLYGELMNQCTSCGVKINPFIKQRYSDISLECGEYSTQVLEMYLSLVQEDPDNRAHYYRKIIEIYSALGNEREARRYEALSKEIM
jgi:tetratricopeptide (TPR) repeat protein